MQFSKLLEHMKENAHFRQTISIRRKETETLEEILFEKAFEKGDFYMAPIQFEFDDRVFFLMGLQPNETSSYYFWLQMYASKIEAMNYYYTLEFHGTDPRCRIVHSTQVISIDETKNSILKDNKCFGFDFKFFKSHYVDENRSYKFSISIRNEKEEAKDDNVESGISDDE